MAVGGDGTSVRTKLPKVYFLWLGGAFASQLGDAAMFFALGWTAAEHGGGAAGLVLTAVTLPRTLLLLLGGAVADRFSPRVILIVGDSAMLVVTVVVALTVLVHGSPLWLLFAAAVLIGVIDAFYLPVSGSMPRRLVGTNGLDRAVGLSQSGSQLIALVGGPLGATLVTFGGLAAAAAFDGVTFAFAVVVAVLVRLRHEVREPDERANILREAARGVTSSLRNPVLRPALILTSAVAGFAIPVGSLLVPLLAHENAWGAQVAGLVLSGEAVGSLIVALAVARWGTIRQPGVVAVASVVPMTLGVGTLAWTGHPAFAVAGGAVFGVGLGLFVTHLGPLMLAAGPDSHLARVQSLIALVQSLALVLTLNVLGRLADVTSAVTAALVCGGTLAAAGFAAMMSPGLRRAALNGDDQ